MEGRNIDIPTNSSVFFLFEKKNILKFWVWVVGGLEAGFIFGVRIYINIITIRLRLG